MSHNVKIENIKITSKEALRKAVEELKAEGVNISYAENADYRGWDSSQSGKFPIVVKMPDMRVDLAFEQNADGSYTPVYDTYLARQIARNGLGYTREELSPEVCDINSPAAGIGKLIQRYGVVAAEEQAAMQGLVAQRSYNEQTKELSLIVEGF